MNNRQDYVEDDFLLRDFEKVSIGDKHTSEWWILRKTPNLFESDANISSKVSDVKNSGVPSDVQEESLNARNIDISYKKRLSDVNASRYLQNRFSNEFDGKSVNKLNCGFKLEPLICKSMLGFMEEELYIKGNVVIWSKGLSYNKEDDATRETVCTYSSTYPVKHALWCKFYCERPTIDSSLVAVEYKPDEPLADPISCVSIIDGQSLRVFTVDNEDFLTSLPFPVSRVWNIKFGMLLERDISGTFS